MNLSDKLGLGLHLLESYGFNRVLHKDKYYYVLDTKISRYESNKEVRRLNINFNKENGIVKCRIKLKGNIEYDTLVDCNNLDDDRYYKTFEYCDMRFDENYNVNDILKLVSDKLESINVEF